MDEVDRDARRRAHRQRHRRPRRDAGGRAHDRPAGRHEDRPLLHAEDAAEHGRRPHRPAVRRSRATTTPSSPPAPPAPRRIGDALDLIRAGRADVTIAGGTEAGLCETGPRRLRRHARALARTTTTPQKASRPFDAERDGFVCRRRRRHLRPREPGARPEARRPILAELAGYGAGTDAYHVVAPSEDGEGAPARDALALEDAGVEPAEVDYINAHGTSTQLNDASETLAIKRVFGERRLPGADQRHEVDDRPRLRRRRRHRVDRLRQVDPDRHRAPDDQLRAPGPDCDLDYVPNEAAQGRTSTSSSRTASASAARTPASSSSASRSSRLIVIRGTRDEPGP